MRYIYCLHNPEHRGVDWALQFRKKYVSGFELEAKIVEELNDCDKCDQGLQDAPSQPEKPEYKLLERERGQIRRQRDLCQEILDMVSVKKKSARGMSAPKSLGKSWFKPSLDPEHDVKVIYRGLPYGSKKQPPVNSQMELFAMKQFANLCINLEAYHHLLPYLNRRHQKLELKDLKKTRKALFPKV